MQKKGNIIATVVVVVVIVALSVILMTVRPGVEPNVVDQKRVEAEAENALQTAIETGIKKWLENGFSYTNKVHYCNYPAPPDLDEAKTSLDRFLTESIKTSMDNLKRENKEYYIADDIEVELPGVDAPGSLPSDANIDTSGFKVGVKTEEIAQNNDLSGPTSLDWPIWDMYTKMHLWMENEAGALHENMNDLAFRYKPCQLIAAGCLCEDAVFDVNDVEDIKLKEADVRRAIDASLAELNLLFQGTSIECSYELDKLVILNKNHTNWTVSDAADTGSPGYESQPSQAGTRQISYNDDHYHGQADSENPRVVYGEYSLMDFPEAGTMPTSGCPDIEGQAGASADARPDLGVDNWVVETYEPYETVKYCTQVEGLVGDDITGDLDQSMKVGMLAMNKFASFRMIVRCADKDIKVSGKQGYESLNAQIVVRFSGMQDCPVPFHQDDITGETPDTCPGGSCFPEGTMVVLSDGSQKPIETVKVGDQVLSLDVETGDFTTGTVLGIESPFREGYYIVSLDDGNSISITIEHPIYTKKATGELGWASIDPRATARETDSIDVVYQLSTGDYVMKKDKSWVKVTSLEYVPGVIQTYNLGTVEGESNFFADDVLAHNKCCFAPGTPVTMADGTKKPIEAVKVGEEVMTYNEEKGQNEAAVVEMLDQPIREGLFKVVFANGKELRMTGDHPLYARKAGGKAGWAAADVESSYKTYGLPEISQLEVGDEVMQEDGSYPEIVSLTYEAGDVQTYTLEKVSKNRNFFANGFLAHNQKAVGFVGLACVLDCPICQGCLYIGGDAGAKESWTCVPVPNLPCANCTLCTNEGDCEMPAPPVMRCLECSRCDGINTGLAACVFNPAEALGDPCTSQECATCSGDPTRTDHNGCNSPVQEPNVQCNVESESDRECKQCSLTEVGECEVNPEKVDRKCGPCTECSSSGMCNQPMDAARDICNNLTNKKCMRCSGTGTGVSACVGDTTLHECDVCERCSADGGCEADPTQNSLECADCKVCSNGACVADPLQNGQTCSTPGNGCLMQCTEGACRATNSGIPASCSFSCGLTGVCSDNGGCESSDKSKKCCEQAICSSTDECCGVGTGSCGKCPEST